MSYIHQLVVENKPFPFWGNFFFCVLISSVASIISYLASDRRWSKQNKITDQQAREIEALKAGFEEQKAFSANAWADYEVRRDAYLETIALLNVLFDPLAGGTMVQFLRSTRKIRLLGTDEIVLALNHLMKACLTSSAVPVDERKQLAQKFMYELRADIRSLRRRPAEGTNLTFEDFLIEI